MDVEELYGKYVHVVFPCHNKAGSEMRCMAQVKFEDEGVVLDVFEIDKDDDVIEMLGTTAWEYQEIAEDE